MSVDIEDIVAYRANPYLERMSERTSDQEFVRLFSPRILERLADDAFDGAVHIFEVRRVAAKPPYSVPSLRQHLRRSGTPAQWSRSTNLIRDCFCAASSTKKPSTQLLGVFLSCASGYADLPPGAAAAQEGLFRALLNCRIVLRALRSLSLLANSQTDQTLDQIELTYDDSAADLRAIPRLSDARELSGWAEQRERSVYALLNSVTRDNSEPIPGFSARRFALATERTIFSSGQNIDAQAPSDDR